ncbi:uracil-DNA glycosylase family protein [Helicobacter sp. MIT 99-5507]|uniref:uracil-DNA glycosylase family protein n=1 Tax=Helicobacter sp. MIT 99-5507 TaxID=152489 RepID=UPI000E1F554C|nr:uracil-DNA glycosylase family protein [Helicobacter sp. MIT 99-5507]RDU57309.1 hypothetical protein CQA42_05000 [Helicobacter sp. MIT 99-5507]
MLVKALLLKQLYIRRLIGENYCENIDINLKKDAIFKSSNLDDVIKNCHLCDLSKASKEKILGLSGGVNSIVFVTLKPILPFSASEIMIKNIAKNVFNEDSYSSFSMIKCNTNVNITDKYMYICKEYLKSQIDALNPRIIILFGEIVARHILQTEEKLENLRGRILESKNLLNKQKDFIVTYAINDLLKNPSLKPLAFDDFKIAKEFLK